MKVWILCHSRLTLLVCVACIVVGARWAQAQPANDNYTNREVITSLRFEDVETAIGQATVEATDPQIFCSQAGVGTGANTVWYSYTTGPLDEYLDFNTVNSDYNTIVAIYTGGPGAFTLVGGGCNDDGISSTRARIAGLRLRPNTTYSIVVARVTLNLITATLRFSVDVAPVYQVTKMIDTADGVCDSDCSLREAISASNVNPGAILVPAGTYVLTLPGVEDNNASGDLDLRFGMGIYGAGATQTVVDAGGLDRVVDIDVVNTGAVSAHLSGLTLTNGNTSQAGGGLRLLNFQDFLALEDVTVRNSVAGTAGGGIAVYAISLLQGVTLSTNRAGTDGGGAYVGGTTVEMRDGTIDHNVSLSVSGGGGGGIYSGTRLRLNQVTISDNAADFAGGGVFVETGSLVMRNTTIVDNVADADNNDTSSGGGVYLFSPANVNIANSVIANNHAYGGVPSDLNDCSRVSNTPLFVSAYNHVRRRDNCFFEGPGDTIITDPLLAPLANNGGTTKTHAVLAGSLLIDAGDPAGCRDDSGVAFGYDQRGPGYARAVGVNCDKGAYEFNPNAPSPPNSPSNLVAIAIGDTSASLQWDDNSNNELSFEIERALSASGPWSPIGSVPANATTFADTTLSPLVDYYFRVFARNAAGDSTPTTALLIHTTPVELQSFTIE